MKEKIVSVWRYRHFIFSSIQLDFRARLARSRLGVAWLVLQPLAQVAIYALILSSVLAAKLPGIENKYSYAIYLMAGMLAWSLFSEIVTRCLTIFIENGNLLKKIVFPKICLPLIVSGTALVNNLLLFLAIILVFAILGHTPGWTLLWLPVMLVLIVALGTGLGLILGVLNVFMRDVGQVVPVLLQFCFWFTPIIYMPSMLPETYRDILELNPLFPLVTSYQAILVYGSEPPFAELIWVMGLATGLLGIALFMFRRASPELVDAL